MTYKIKCVRYVCSGKSGAQLCVASLCGRLCVAGRQAALVDGKNI